MGLRLCFFKFNIQNFSNDFRSIARKSKPFSLSLSGVKTFENPKGVTAFLAIQINSDLFSIHETIHNMAQRFGCSPKEYYLKGRRTPHCTLASNLNQDGINKTVEYVSKEVALPIQGMVDRIGLIETPAEIEMDEFPLGSG